MRKKTNWFEWIKINFCWIIDVLYKKEITLNVKGETNERKMKIMGKKTNTEEKDKKFLD